MVFAVFFHGILPETEILYGYIIMAILYNLQSLKLEFVDLPCCLGSLLLRSSPDALYSGLKYISLGQ